jgi:ketosteroid isomerase-like protein
MIEKLNTGDVEGSLAFFTDDAVVYIMGFPPTGLEIYKGKDQIRKLWEDSASNHFKWEAEVKTVYENMVYMKARTWHDFTRQIGVAPLEYTDVYEISDGKIATYGSWLTMESLGRFKPAFATAVPRAPTPTPVTTSGVSEFVVTIAGDSCKTDNPVALKPGEVKVTVDVQDKGKSAYALTIFNLDEGKDLLDLMVTTAGSPPSWGDMILFEELDPGETQTYTFKLENGPVYLICWSKPPDMPIGNAGPIPVVP